MKKKNRFYKLGFWLAVIIIVLLVYSITKLYSPPVVEAEGGENVSEDYVSVELTDETDEEELTEDIVEVDSGESSDESSGIAEEVGEALDEASDAVVDAVDTAAEEVTDAIVDVAEEIEAVAPVIAEIANPSDVAATITVTEGDLVSFPNLAAEDPDGDTVTFSFSEPLDANGEWLTTEGDAGEYTVVITASDGDSSVSESVLVVVEAKNRPPVIIVVDSVTLNEGDTLLLDPKVTDPEGEPVDISFSGWMTTNTRETGFNDAGEYEVIIKASDGELESMKTVSVTVENVNRKPQFKSII